MRDLKYLKSKTSAIFTLLIAILISFLPQTSQANTPRAWSSENLPAIGAEEMQALFGTQVFSASSNLNWSVRITPTELGKDIRSNQPWIYYAIPACNSSIPVGCIERVEYKKVGQDWLQASLSTREIVKRNGEISPSGRNSSGVISNSEINEWPADLENHAPAAGRASYWNFNQAPHGGGSEYLLRVNISGVNSAAPTWSNGKVQRYLEMGVFPVNGFTEYQFPDDLQIKVRLKLGPIAKDLWGWFDGRVINPNVTLDVNSLDGIVEIAGAPSKTPMGLTTKKKVSEIGPEILSIFGCPAGLSPSQCPSRSGLKWFSTDGNSDVNTFATFEKDFGAISTVGYKTEWWIKTTRWPDVATVRDCPAEQNGFTGIVTTNSTMYGTSAPEWDPSDKTFVFQVASPHYGLNGALNTGYYSLILPRTLAECRWGRDISQAKVIVSVISADGNSNVGAASYSIRDNLLTFNVSGFNYSSPKIKIGLATPPAPVATPTPTPTPVVTQTPPTVEAAAPVATQTAKPALSKKVTITCVKGKLIKKVTAVKPLCPVGYKKK
jgi:hypothetical protein